jgi:hypothetical protein
VELERSDCAAAIQTRIIAPLFAEWRHIQKETDFRQ